MAIGDWAAAIGAGVGGMVGAAATIAIQARGWVYRWDPNRLEVFASFLEHASHTFDWAARVSPDSDPQVLERFHRAYGRLATAYERLVLLDADAQDQARRLTWILWNMVSEVPLAPSDYEMAIRSYRDARHHVREAAQRSLRLPRHNSIASEAQECDTTTHDVELGKPPHDSPWSKRQV
jgi:hypothetical protein